jgi:hypothetical protein
VDQVCQNDFLCKNLVLVPIMTYTFYRNHLVLMEQETRGVAESFTLRPVGLHFRLYTVAHQRGLPTRSWVVVLKCSTVPAFISFVEGSMLNIQVTHARTSIYIGIWCMAIDIRTRKHECV